MKTLCALILLLAALPMAGCSTPVVRPPSPAVQTRFQDLEAPPVPAGEHYYLLVFGAQSTPKIPRFTHCWISAVKVADRGPGARPLVEHQSVSWMPATLQVRTWQFCVEPGKNLDLHTSIAMSLAKGERVSVWGPFETSERIYRKVLLQKAFLEGGRVGYQCIDLLGESARQGNAYNCVHAISAIDPLFDPRDFPIYRFGDAASETAVRRLAECGALVDPGRTHDWLIPLLHLECYPLCRRQ